MVDNGKVIKTIGFIGGLSRESSAEYYRIINQGMRQRLDGVHSVRSLMFSVDFEEIGKLQHSGAWDRLTQEMIDAARALENGGAAFFLVCSNTMHCTADAIQASVSIPFLHIVEPTAANIRRAGVQRVDTCGLCAREAGQRRKRAADFAVSRGGDSGG